MVNKIRKALGFMLFPGGSSVPLPEVPYIAEQVVVRACPLRGYSDKKQDLQVYLLPGNNEQDIFRSLREVVVEADRPPKKVSPTDGLNLVVFRGVFGSGGYAIEVKDVKWVGRVLTVECNFEDPGDGIMNTAGFTQPTAVIPLKQLPAGKYKVKLMARNLRRSSKGVAEEVACREITTVGIRVG